MPADAPLLTVAICTWNRAERLRRALASLAVATVPRGLAWEIVVADNGSSDHTASIVASFDGRLPVRRIEEPTLGLSHARNAAVRAARGRYVAWLDDDVFVDAGWLAAYAAATTAWPDAALFGGPIAPHFDVPPPEWLRRALPVVGNAYALLDLGPSPRALDGDAVPFGANYMLRATEQRRHPYAARLGRVGTALGAGEETAVARAIRDEGGAGRWVPDARVRHLVPAERQSLAYLRRYYMGNWASHQAAGGARTVPTLFGRPRWAWRRVVEQELLYRVTRAVAGPERWAPHFRRASEAWGALRGGDDTR